MEPFPVAPDARMSFSLLNKRMALLEGPGKWLRWVKERGLVGQPLSTVFQRSSGALACPLTHAFIMLLYIRFVLPCTLCALGVYGIYCEHYHAEDIEDYETSEGIPHLCSCWAKGADFFGVQPFASSLCPGVLCALVPVCAMWLFVGLVRCSFGRLRCQCLVILAVCYFYNVVLLLLGRLLVRDDYRVV